MPDSALDPVLTTLSYEVIEMLCVFRDTPSFKDVAAKFNRDERTVSRQLREVDEAFHKTQQVHILDREHGGKNYRLTPAGEDFVRSLMPIGAAMRDAIKAVTTATRRVPVLCTQNCLTRLSTLREALPPRSGFNIIPLPKRSADIDLIALATDPDIQVCLASALMSSEQDPEVGVIAQWSDQIEVLPLEISAPQLLAVDNLGLPEAITVRDVVEAGVTFLTPPGGVAWEFLNRNYADWYKLRPFQHSPVPDLDYGLKCLATRAVPRSAMVVHGFDLERRRRTEGLERAYTQDFAVSGGSHQLVAVTGVFRIRQETRSAANPYDVIWQTAQDLWSEKERIL